MVDLADIEMGFSEGDARVAFVGDDEYASVEALVAAVPDLVSEAPVILARAVVHFARGRAYRVIEDPARFAERYRAQVAREDPDQPWQEGVFRLRDFGAPDYDKITAPLVGDGGLTCFAEDRATGLPYCVTAPTSDLSAPGFAPVPLFPIEG